MADAPVAHEPGSAHGGGHTAHDTPHVNYLLVFLALCVFTGLSVVFDVLDLKGERVFGVLNGTIVLAFLVLAVATAKALCVMAFFMHLAFERNWKYLLLAPTVILALGLPLALLPDIGVHYYTTDTPQRSQLAPQPVAGAPDPVDSPGAEPIPHE